MSKKKTLLKAYENIEFLNSSEARILRMLAEFLEPQSKFRKHKVIDTIVFFGSARIMPLAKAKKLLEKFSSLDPKTAGFAQKLRVAQRNLYMAKYYEDAVELSRRLTEWSLGLETYTNRFIICTGGGPGIMEAANKGAKEAGGLSVGLNISIPFEQFVNKYVTPELQFEFHYFFMRKFWFAYLAKALIVFPGGFGTMDEMFELLTLLQTGKIKKNMLVVVYDEKYWKSIVNFEGLADAGMISKEDFKLFTFTSTIDETFEIIKKHFEKNYLNEKINHITEPKVTLG